MSHYKYIDGYVVSIPFAGFYSGSYHESEIERAVENLSSDDSGTPHLQIHDRLCDLVNWHGVRENYAAAYAAAFAHHFNLEGSEPTVTQDHWDGWQITVRFDRESLAKIVQATRGRWKDSITRRIKDEGLDRLDLLAPPTRWGDEEWRVALLVYLDSESSGGFDNYAEYGVVEDLSGNGVIDNWLFETVDDGARTKMNRLCRVAAWVQRRDRYGAKVPTCVAPAESLPLFAKDWKPDVGQLAGLRGVNGHGAALACSTWGDGIAEDQAAQAFDKLAELAAMGGRNAALCLWAWQKWLAHTPHKTTLLRAMRAPLAHSVDLESVLGWRV